MEDRLNGIEARLARIEMRNSRVDDAKAWEISLTRRAAISALTYMVMVSLLLVIRADRPFLGAMVPVAGYLLSTQSLPFIRYVWRKRREENR